MFYPYAPIRLWGGATIVSLTALGHQPILDFTVEQTHCYESGGVIHHNTGKSVAGAYETTCHLTGLYPAWWQGRRFTRPVDCWACGTNTETTRDIVQAKLIGPVDAPGTGMIPAELIMHKTPRRGVPGALETVWIRHNSGGMSKIGFKSYEMGRKAFEGTSKEVIWADEESPLDCYTEMLYRTVTTRGIALTTFTPLQGMSDMVRGFLEPESPESEKYKWHIQAGWDDVPHIPEEEKKALLATTPPYLIGARTRGEPSLGAGAIYPLPEAEITVPTTEIPESWPRVYSMDVGWNRTAALWCAKNPGTNQLIAYSEHYQSMGEPASHAASIKGRGEWIKGVIDPASLGSNQIDGRTLMEIYGKLGLMLEPADNAVESGIQLVWEYLVSGRLKIQAHLFNFFREYRQYHRDERGKIVKKLDHLMDTCRYLVVSGQQFMAVKPERKSYKDSGYSGERSWMG